MEDLGSSTVGLIQSVAASKMMNSAPVTYADKFAQGGLCNVCDRWKEKHTSNEIKVLFAILDLVSVLFDQLEQYVRSHGMSHQDDLRAVSGACSVRLDVVIEEVFLEFDLCSQAEGSFWRSTVSSILVKFKTSEGVSANVKASRFCL